MTDINVRPDCRRFTRNNADDNKLTPDNEKIDIELQFAK